MLSLHITQGALLFPFIAWQFLFLGSPSITHISGQRCAPVLLLQLYYASRPSIPLIIAPGKASKLYTPGGNFHLHGTLESLVQLAPQSGRMSQMASKSRWTPRFWMGLVAVAVLLATCYAGSSPPPVDDTVTLSDSSNVGYTSSTVTLISSGPVTAQGADITNQYTGTGTSMNSYIRTQTSYTISSDLVVGVCMMIHSNIPGETPGPTATSTWKSVTSAMPTSKLGLLNIASHNVHLVVDQSGTLSAEYAGKLKFTPGRGNPSYVDASVSLTLGDINTDEWQWVALGGDAKDSATRMVLFVNGLSGNTGDRISGSVDIGGQVYFGAAQISAKYHGVSGKFQHLHIQSSYPPDATAERVECAKLNAGAVTLWCTACDRLVPALHTLTFGAYIPPQLVEELSSSTSSVTVGGQACTLAWSPTLPSAGESRPLQSIVCGSVDLSGSTGQLDVTLTISVGTDFFPVTAVGIVSIAPSMLVASNTSIDLHGTSTACSDWLRPAQGTNAYASIAVSLAGGTPVVRSMQTTCGNIDLPSGTQPYQDITLRLEYGAWYSSQVVIAQPINTLGDVQAAPYPSGTTSVSIVGAKALLTSRALPTASGDTWTFKASIDQVDITAQCGAQSNGVVCPIPDSCSTTDTSASMQIQLLGGASGSALLAEQTMSLSVARNLSNMGVQGSMLQPDFLASAGGTLITFTSKALLLCTTAGQAHIAVGGAACSKLLPLSSSQGVHCVTPAGSGVRHAVTVAVPSIASTETVGRVSYAPPSITSVQPESFPPAVTLSSARFLVVVRGSNFYGTSEQPIVSVLGGHCSITARDSTSITCWVLGSNMSALDSSVQVTYGHQTGNATGPAIALAPALSTLAPADTAVTGAVLIISGSQLRAAIPTTWNPSMQVPQFGQLAYKVQEDLITAYVGSMPCDSITVMSAAQIMCMVPVRLLAAGAQPINASVRVQSATGIWSNLLPIQVTAGPRQPPILVGATPSTIMGVAMASNETATIVLSGQNMNFFAAYTFPNGTNEATCALGLRCTPPDVAIIFRPQWAGAQSFVCPRESTVWYSAQRIACEDVPIRRISNPLTLAGEADVVDVSATIAGLSANLSAAISTLGAPFIEKLTVPGGTVNTPGQLEVVIAGKNFGVTSADMRAPLVRDSLRCSPWTWLSAQTLLCTIPAGVGTLVPLTVQTRGGLMATTRFNYTAPSLVQVTPSIAFNTSAHVLLAYNMTVRGKNFGARIDNATLLVGGVRCAAPIMTLPHTEITCQNMPGTFSSGGAEVRVAGQTSSSSAAAAQLASKMFEVVGGPVIAAVAPPVLPVQGGVRVFLFGANFGTVATDVLHVWINGRACTDPKYDASKLSCVVPPGAGSGLSVRMQTRGGKVSPESEFAQVAYAAPEITAVRLKSTESSCAALFPAVPCTLNASLPLVTGCVYGGIAVLEIHGVNLAASQWQVEADQVSVRVGRQACLLQFVSQSLLLCTLDVHIGNMSFTGIHGVDYTANGQTASLAQSVQVLSSTQVQQVVPSAAQAGTEVSVVIQEQPITCQHIHATTVAGKACQGALQVVNNAVECYTPVLELNASLSTRVLTTFTTGVVAALPFKLLAENDVVPPSAAPLALRAVRDEANSLELTWLQPQSALVSTYTTPAATNVKVLLWQQANVSEAPTLTLSLGFGDELKLQPLNGAGAGSTTKYDCSLVSPQVASQRAAQHADAGLVDQGERAYHYCRANLTLQTTMAIRASMQLFNGKSGPRASPTGSIMPDCTSGSFLASHMPAWEDVVCMDCPVGADCSARQYAQLLPLPGYFRAPWVEHGMAFIACPDPTACAPAGNGSSAGYTRCLNGHAGVLCAQCDSPKYARTSTGCTACPAPAASWTLVLLLAMVALLVLGYLVRTTIQSRGATSKPSVALRKILLNHLQQVSLALSFNWQFPGAIQDVLTAFDTASSVSNAMMYIDCLIPAGGVSTFRLRVIGTLAAPVLLVIGMAMFWSLHTLVHWRAPPGMAREIARPSSNRPDREHSQHHLKRRQRMWISHNAQRAVLSIIIMAFLLHASLTRATLRLLTCKALEPTSGFKFLIADYDIRCDTESNQVWQLAVAVPAFLLYGAGIPAAFAALLWSKRRTLTQPHTRELYGFIYSGYDDKFYYMESIIMLRKAALVLVIVFMSPYGVLMQAYAGVMVLLCALTLQVNMLPYRMAVLNYAEEASLLVAIVTLMGGLFLETPAKPPGTAVMVTIALIGLNVGFVATVAALLFVAFLDEKNGLAGAKQSVKRTLSKFSASSRALNLAPEISMEYAPERMLQGSSKRSLNGLDLALDAADSASVLHSLQSTATPRSNMRRRLSFWWQQVTEEVPDSRRSQSGKHTALPRHRQSIAATSSPQFQPGQVSLPAFGSTIPSTVNPMATSRVPVCRKLRTRPPAPRPAHASSSQEAKP